MTVVPLHCPICDGLVQVDVAHAGQEVACPHCRGIMVVPDLGSSPPISPPTNDLTSTGFPWAPRTTFPFPSDVAPSANSGGLVFEPPPPFEPPIFSPLADAAPPAVGGELLSLTCPICGGLFQAHATSAGQQVACPHCAGIVTLPPLEAGPAIAPPPPEHLSPASRPATLSHPTSGPPATVPVPAPIPFTPVPLGEPPSPVGRSASPPASVPPAAKMPGPPDPSQQPPATVRNNPPASKPPEVTQPPSSKGPETQAPTGVPKQPSPPAPPTPPPSAPARPPRRRKTADELLPPSAPAASSSSAEPAARGEARTSDAGSGTSVSAPSPAPSLPQPSLADTLLPPGATELAPTQISSVAEVALPSVPTNPAEPPAHVPADAVIVPAPDGSYAMIRKKAKTVGQGDEAVELAERSPEEKRKRRFRYNLIIWSICFTILLVVLLVLAWPAVVGRR